RPPALPPPQPPVAHAQRAEVVSLADAQHVGAVAVEDEQLPAPAEGLDPPAGPVGVEDELADPGRIGQLGLALARSDRHDLVAAPGAQVEEEDGDARATAQAVREGGDPLAGDPHPAAAWHVVALEAAVPQRP